LFKSVCQTSSKDFSGLYFFGKIYFKGSFLVGCRAAKYIAVMVDHDLFGDSQAHARAAVL